MKLSLLPVFFLLLTSIASGQSVSQLIAEGVRLKNTGDTAAAKAKFEEVLVLEPGHPRARFFIRQIETAKAEPSTGALRRQLEQLTVPEVNFRDASLTSVLDFLKQLAKEQSELDVNFVPAVPPAVMEGGSITLSLRQVPYLELLRYVGGLSKVTFSVEEHAVVIRPASTPESPAAPAAQPEGGQTSPPVTQE